MNPFVEKIRKLGIQRESGFLYFVDASGNVCRVKMSGRMPPTEVIAPIHLEKESGYLYFLDAAGDVSRVKEISEAA